VAIVKILVWWT